MPSVDPGSRESRILARRRIPLRRPSWLDRRESLSSPLQARVKAERGNVDWTYFPPPLGFEPRSLHRAVYAFGSNRGIPPAVASPVGEERGALADGDGRGRASATGKPRSPRLGCGHESHQEADVLVARIHRPGDGGRRGGREAT